MTTALEALLRDVRRRHVLVDSNLLVLHVTMARDPRLIRQFKRTQHFSYDDAVFLAWLFDAFAGVVTTPHVLTETSNLGNSLSSVARDTWFAALADFVAEAGEIGVDARTICAWPGFGTFGLTDCAVAVLAESHVVIATDGRLARALSNEDVSVFHFDDLKMLL